MIKGYITNLGKYNEGVLVGKWINFPIDEDELQEVFDEIGINEEYEEYFFTDWESPIDFGEYENIDRINELAELIEDADEDLVKAICEEYGIEELDNIDNYCLCSDITTDEDIGYYYAAGTIDIPEHIKNYFDYEAYGRDIRLEGCYGTMTDYGWLEKF